ncbi:MAG: ABC transporter permease [Defluviitaleaceae bacterium]|nr:ABC transporter permease [Defluviitaleaceae bacterium]
MIRRFCSQVWLGAKRRQGGLGPAEFLIYRVGLSITTLLLYVLIAQHVTGGEIDLTAWVIGNAFALCIYQCVFNIGGTFEADRFFGVLKIIVVSPTSKMAVIMHNAAYALLTSSLTIIFAFIAGGLIFGVSFGDLHIGMFVLAILVASFACTGLGLLFAAFALITDSMYLMLNALAMILIIFSGANFPIAQMPVFAQWIANAFPLYRSVAAGNMAMGGSFSGEFANLLIGEVMLGITFYLIAFALIKIIERISIRKATLEMF